MAKPIGKDGNRLDIKSPANSYNPMFTLGKQTGYKLHQLPVLLALKALGNEREREKR